MDNQEFDSDASYMDYDLVGEGFDSRTIAIVYNASSIVSIGTIVLGLFFAITAVVLIFIYLSTLGGGSTVGRRSYEYADSEEVLDSHDWVRIISDLEEAYIAYGMTKANDKCRRRLLCQVYMPNAVSVNKEAALRFSTAVGRLTPSLTEGLRGSARLLTEGVLEAANRGRDTSDCSHYTCDQYSLASLTKKDDVSKI